MNTHALLSDAQAIILRAAFGPPDRYAAVGEYPAINLLRFEDDILVQMGAVLRDRDYDGVEIYGRRYVIAMTAGKRYVMSPGLGQRVGDGLELDPRICYQALTNTPPKRSLRETTKSRMDLVWMMLIGAIFTVALAQYRPLAAIVGAATTTTGVLILLGPYRYRKWKDRVTRALIDVGYLQRTDYGGCLPATSF